MEEILVIYLAFSDYEMLYVWFKANRMITFSSRDVIREAQFIAAKCLHIQITSLKWHHMLRLN